MKKVLETSSEIFSFNMLRGIRISQIELIFINESYQGLGISSVLMDSYREMLDEIGYFSTLSVATDSSHTVGMYSRKGFEFTPESKDVIRSWVEGVNTAEKINSINRDCSSLGEEGLNMIRKLDFKEAL